MQTNGMTAGTTAIGLQQAAGPESTGTDEARNSELRQVAQQFEAIFLRQMIGAMRSSSLAEGMFDSSATEQFRDMADARTADEMSKTGGFGIAQLLMRQLAPETSSSVKPADAYKAMSAETSATAAAAASSLPVAVTDNQS